MELLLLPFSVYQARALCRDGNETYLGFWTFGSNYISDDPIVVFTNMA